MLTQLHGFKVSVYSVDRESGYNSLVNEFVAYDYGKAVRKQNELKSEFPVNTNIVVSEAIYLI